MRLAILAAAVVLAAGACRGPVNDPEPAVGVGHGVSVAADGPLAVTVTGTGALDALDWYDVAAGDGPTVGSDAVVTAHVVAVAAGDGTEIMSTVDGDPISFPVGVGAVVPAWDDALPDARVGARRVIVAPAEDAWGAAGVDGIVEPGTDVIFAIDILAARTAGS